MTPHSIVSRSPLSRGRIAPDSSRWSSLRPTTIRSTLPSPWISTGERRKRSTILRGLPPAEHQDLLDPVLGEGVDRVLGRIGRLELFAVQAKHARDVGGDVPVA